MRPGLSPPPTLRGCLPSSTEARLKSPSGCGAGARPAPLPRCRGHTAVARHGLVLSRSWLSASRTSRIDTTPTSWLHRITGSQSDRAGPTAAQRRHRGTPSRAAPADPGGRLPAPPPARLGRSFIGHLERILEAKGLYQHLDAPPCVCFVDLTGYTRVTEEQGDAVAASRLAGLAGRGHLPSPAGRSAGWATAASSCFASPRPRWPR